MDEFIRTMNSEAMWLFCYVIVGLHVLAVVLRAVEWAISERKW